MTPIKILNLIERYEQELAALGVPKQRIDVTRTFASLTKDEMLAHAHCLCTGVKEYATDPDRQRKTGSHLSAIQMCLSFAGLYTLEELMDHNRP
ncbi:MAG: hypothetical protein JWL75_800 [Parcubacteria group bacterium]|nr:hypothetical protein [Parcubacteria group bacterium]